MASLEDTVSAEKIREQARDLYKLKITLPLGNKNLKYVHTNQFLWTDFPKDTFPLANWKYIAEALDGDETSHSGYVKNRWFIESCTITNDGNNAKMELELNPFATNQRSYINDYESFTKAYEDANNQNNDNTNTDSIPSVASDNTTATGGEGELIDNQVKEIIGNETDVFEKAKKIHNWLLKNRRYCKYTDTHPSIKSGKTLQARVEKAYKRRMNPGLNCADTSRLTASMFRSAGIDCDVVHAIFHYYVVFYYNGQEHCSDTATSGNKRKIDHYWKSSGGWSGTTVKFTGGSKCYPKGKNGKEPAS